MTITIPTDEALGLHIKRIIAAVALVAVAFYAAGYVLGAAVHQLNASLTRLPLPTIASALHAHTHPALPVAHGNDRPRAVRPRQPQRQSRSSGVGFA